MIASTKERSSKVKDGVKSAEARDAKRRRKQPIHGRSLVHVMNAIKNRGEKGAKGGRVS